MRIWRMRKPIIIDLLNTGRQRRAAIVTDRNGPQKHVRGAQIVLLTADGCATMELTRRTGTSKTPVWRWQERFVAEGVPGLLRDKARPTRIPPLGGRSRGPAPRYLLTTARPPEPCWRCRSHIDGNHDTRPNWRVGTITRASAFWKWLGQLRQLLTASRVSTPTWIRPRIIVNWTDRIRISYRRPKLTTASCRT
jgi:hypothetical protein